METAESERERQREGGRRGEVAVPPDTQRQGAIGSRVKVSTSQ